MFNTKNIKQLIIKKDKEPLGSSIHMVYSELISFSNIFDVLENISFPTVHYIDNIHNLISLSNFIAYKSRRGKALYILTNQKIENLPKEFHIRYNKNFQKSVIYFKGVTYPDMDSAILENENEYQLHTNSNILMAEFVLTDKFKN